MSRWSWLRSRRHDVLEDVLEDVIVDNAEIDRQDGGELYNGDAATSGKIPSDQQAATTCVHNSYQGRRPVAEPSSSTSPANRAGRSRLTSVIMMYSPDIPSIDEQRDAVAANSSRSADIGNYYSRIDTEETVKCVVTSVLFCAVVVMIVLVAVFKNPGM